MASITDLILGGVKTLANAAANNSQNNAAQSAATPASSVANTQSAPVSSASSGSNSYTPIGTHNDATVRQQSAQDTAQLQSLSDQWHAATAAGNTAAAAEYHRQAEAIRAGYGYSGGQDGSDYLGQSNAAAHVTHSMSSPTLPQPNSYEQAIRDMNAAYQQQQLAGLRNAYDNSVVNLDRAEAQIAPTYQNARNQTAATNAQNARAMNEAFAARGLNTGTTGQAALAQNSVLQRDMTTLNESEAEAISEIQLQRRTLENEYQFAIENARATGNYQLAQNLLSEWQRYDNALMSTALNQFGIDLQAANFNYGVYSDQRAFDEGVRQYDQSFGANRADTAWNQNFQQSQADRDYQQWLAQMGANVGDFSGLQSMGVNPTDQYLASYNQSLLPRASGGSSSSSPTLTFAQARSLIEGGTVTTSAAEIYSAATGIPLAYIYEMYGEPIDAVSSPAQNAPAVQTPRTILPAGRSAYEYVGMFQGDIGRADMIEQLFNNGEITEAEARELLRQFGLG